MWTAPNKSDWVDVQKERSRASFERSFWVKNVGFSEGLFERVNTEWTLMQKVPKVRCWTMRRCNSQKHGICRLLSQRRLATSTAVVAILPLTRVVPV